MTLVQVVCPSPSCPGRSIQGQEVLRESWNATWHSLRQYGLPSTDGEWASDITCPRCGTEGIDPESGLLDSTEEELGERCEQHGIVWCPQCPMTEGETLYRQAERARLASHVIAEDASPHWKGSV